jgi:hypothetical protein
MLIICTGELSGASVIILPLKTDCSCEKPGEKIKIKSRRQ